LLSRSKILYASPNNSDLCRYRIHQEQKKINPVNISSPFPRILLSGASGMIGTALQRALAAHRFSALQLVRTPQPVNANPKAVLVAIPGQFPWNPAATPPIAHSQVLEGFAAAIHLSGANVAAHRWTSSYKREMALSRVQSTRALAELLAGLRKPPQTFLIASAIGIYGNRGDELLDESSAPGSGFLADLCRQWEAAAQPAVDAGIRVVHLRFGVILGPGPGALAKMLPVFRLGLGGTLGSGRQWVSWISLDDVIAAILFILETPTVAGPVNLTSPNPVTNGQLTRALSAALHRPAVLPAPAFALRLALGQMADEALLASARAVPSRLLAAGFQFAHPTVAQALAAAFAPHSALS
jgi:hypothetical protein